VVVQNQGGQIRGSEIRDFVFPFNMTVAGSTTAKTNARHVALKLDPATMPALSTLVSEYEKVDFATAELEVISTGGAASVHQVWAAVVPDTAALATPVHEIPTAMLLQSRTGTTLQLEASFARFDPAVVTTRRSRLGAMFRIYAKGDAAVTADNLDFVFRIRGTVACYGRVD